MPPRKSKTSPGASSPAPRITIKKTRAKKDKKPVKAPVIYRAPSAPFRLLTFDQSTKVTGWAVIDVVPGGVLLAEYGILDVYRDENKKALEMDERVPFFTRKISALIEHFKPDAVSCEMPFIARNIGTGVKLFRCFGAVEAIAALKGVPFYYCSPDEAKEFVCRSIPNWRALPGESKVIVKTVLSNQFKVPFCYPLDGPKGHDVCDDSDAVAVGLQVLYTQIGPAQAVA